MQEQDAVGDLAREAHLVRDDDHGRAVARELAHDGQHLVGELGVERGGRLVEQHDLRLHRERARDRHALLLPAGQPRRIFIGLVAQAARGRRHSSASSSASLRGQAADADRRLDDVAEHGHVRPQVELLEHDAEVAPHAVDLAQRPRSTAARSRPSRKPSDSPSMKISPAVGISRWLMQRSSVLLPEPLAPIMLTTLAAVHVERDALQHLERAELLVNVDDPDRTGCSRFIVACGARERNLLAMDSSLPHATIVAQDWLGNRDGRSSTMQCTTGRDRRERSRRSTRRRSIVDLDAFERNVAQDGDVRAGTAMSPAPARQDAQMPRRSRCGRSRSARSGNACQKVGEAEALVRGGIADMLVSNQVVGDAQAAAAGGARRATRPSAVLRRARAGRRSVARVARELGVRIGGAGRDRGRHGALRRRAGRRRRAISPGGSPTRRACGSAGLQAYHGRAQHLADHRRARAGHRGAVEAVRETLAGAARGGPARARSSTGAGTGTFRIEAASGV